MIAIVNYDNLHSQMVGLALEKSGIDYSITLNEAKIINSNGLILPDCEDLKLVLRKIQLCNLFNALRLYHKPILGINSGFLLMCEHIQPDNLSCLAFVPIEAEKTILPEGEMTLEIEKLVDFVLLKGIVKASVKFCNIKYFISKNDFTTSSWEKDSRKYSSTIEYKNYYGTQFNPELSGSVGIRILKNFHDVCK